ncbi:MAG: radical SAM protein [Nitrospirae bacterium]|nr:radical SAM protein [Nitrospirota bacterium]
MIDFRLEKKRRKLLADETGTIHKQGAGYSVALVYPNVYSVGMGNLGFQAVYGYLNGLDGVSCERAFLPDHEDLPLYEKHDTHLFTLESGRPITAFDLLAFSISFEDDLLNLPRLFRLSRLPLLARARSDRHPLVLGGGMCAFMNPEPMAPMMDFLFLGEAEAGISEVLEALLSVERGSGNREEALTALLRVPGVYVPRSYEVVYDERAWVSERRPLKGAPTIISKLRAEMLKGFVTKSVVYTPNSDFGAMHLVEVTRGCGWRCRFCAEGYTYLPPRTYDADAILRTLPQGEGIRKVGLVGTSLPEHPHLLELLRGAALDQRTVCTASLRMDGANREVLTRMSEGAQKTLTIAPEAGNERMRRVINKPISDAALFRSVETAMDCGIKHIKLYFIVGLPFEEDEDVKDVARLGEHIWGLIQSKSRHADSKLTLSVNPFIPKPSTPFQWCGLKPEPELKRKVASIKNGLAHIERVHVSGYSPRQAVLQSLLSIGDRRVGEAMANAAGDQGSARGHWAAEFPPKDWIVHRAKDVGETLPWDFIDHGVRKSFLVDEYRRAEAEVRTRACHVPTCRICGVCTDESASAVAPGHEHRAGGSM